MVLRLFLAFLQEFVGLYGMFVNLLVFRSLNACTRLTCFTLALMKVQCSINFIGLVPIVFYSPWALGFSTDWFKPGSYMMNILGAVLAFSVYCQFGLQALMAVNRLIMFRYRERVDFYFPRRRVNVLVALCIIYGALHGSAVLSSCCNVAYLAEQGRWYTNGTHVDIQKKVQLVLGEMVTFPVMIGCQIGAVLSIDKLRKQLTDKKMSEEKFKTEIRIMFQFLLVAALWVMYSGFFRLMQFVPSARGPVAAVMAETARYLFLIIDPTLYLIFLEQLRAKVTGFLNRNIVQPLN